MIYTVADILVVAIPAVLAITLHEAAHGYVALLFGDELPLRRGRITLNPLKHIDPVGTVLLPLVLVLLNAGFVFGYAKPVPVNTLAFYNPKRTMIWVALAGPIANFCLALVSTTSALLLSATHWVIDGFPFSGYLIRLCLSSVAINMVLGILNILPIPPLDGGRVLMGVLPNSANKLVAQSARVWLPALIVVLVMGRNASGSLNPFALLNIPVDYVLHGIAQMLGPAG